MYLNISRLSRFNSVQSEIRISRVSGPHWHVFSAVENLLPLWFSETWCVFLSRFRDCYFATINGECQHAELQNFICSISHCSVRNIWHSSIVQKEKKNKIEKQKKTRVVWMKLVMNFHSTDIVSAVNKINLVFFFHYFILFILQSTIAFWIAEKIWTRKLGEKSNQTADADKLSEMSGSLWEMVNNLAQNQKAVVCYLKSKEIWQSSAKYLTIKQNFC